MVAAGLSVAAPIVAVQEEHAVVPGVPAAVSSEVVLTAGVHGDKVTDSTVQKPPVPKDSDPDASCAAASAGRARWTVATADFKRDSCRFDPLVFEALVEKTGRAVTLDAYASGAEHALSDSWCGALSFLQQDCSKQHVWLDPPHSHAKQFIEHYIACKEQQPATTSAVVLVPRDKSLKPLLQGMRLLKTFSTGTRLYNATSGCTPQPGIPTTVQVWYDPPASIAVGRLMAVGPGAGPAVTLQSSDGSLTFVGGLSGVESRVHIDSGATHSFVASHFVHRAGLAVMPAARTVALADGQLVKVRGLCRARLRLGRDITDVLTFMVLDLDAAYNVLLGQDWLQRRAAVLAFGASRVTVAVKGVPETLAAGLGSASSGGETPCGRVSALRFKRLAKKPGTEFFMAWVRRVDEQEAAADARAAAADARCAAVSFVAVAGDDTLIPKERLQQILREHEKVFEQLPNGVIRRKGLPEMSIEFEEGKQPPVGYQYRLTQPERQELEKQLALALEKGWVEPSTAPFGAPVLFAQKKGGSLRWCTDYRALNSITVKNRYPLPRIDDLLDQLNGAACFSGLDLASGYWQIPMKTEDRYKTAFRTPHGLYQWTVMPFGLTNAPAVFSQTMQQVFADMIGRFVLVYLDDILIYSKTPAEHEKHLEMVLARLQQHELYAQLRKCHFALPEVEFLGHIVSKQGIRVDPRKVEIVKNWPVPGNLSELRSFLGLSNYFRRFIHAYSSIARPLHGLTGKDVKWEWTGVCQRAFDMLKEKLTAAPVLAAPDFSKPFEVVADASDLTLGAILLQEGRPIAFESRKLTPAECNYHTTEKELLAVMHALIVWRCYLDGARFTIFCDHEPLKYLRSKATLSPRQVRWSQYLERFHYEWEYRPGRLNAADPLSRVSHASVGGSGTGSLTGREQASETVLELLAAVSTRTQRAPKRPYSPPQSPKRRRRAANTAPAAAINKGSTSKVLPVTEQLAASMRDDLVAAYKEIGDKLTAIVARYGLRQTDDGMWCHQQHVYVPSAVLQQRCIQESHDAPYAGHKGVTKTLAAVQRLYWWPGMRAAVQNYVTTCTSCQRNKVMGKKPIGLLQPLEVPAAPWAEVTMDFVTGLPCTVAGHDAVMVMCDRLTKMVHFAACTKTVDATGAARLFRDHVFAAHGLPVSIISDRDARFTSEFWSSLMHLLGVKHKLSTAFHPQTDGQTERVNRVLEEYLRHYVNPSQDDWDEYLSLAEFAYNNSVHEATGATPFFLNFGLHPRLPGAVRTQLQPVPTAVADFARHMTEIIGKAKERLEKARQRSAAVANPKRRLETFTVGAEVLLSARNIALKTPGSNKLLPKFVGPFVVTEVLSPVTYRLELPTNMKCHDVFHASLLIPYRTDGREQPQPPPLEFDDGEDGQWYEIDLILSHRKVRLGSKVLTQYLVKWTGYGDEWNEWRDAVGVTAAATEDYWARVGGRSAEPPHKRKTRGNRAGHRHAAGRRRRVAG